MPRVFLPWEKAYIGHVIAVLSKWCLVHGYHGVVRATKLSIWIKVQTSNGINAFQDNASALEGGALVPAFDLRPSGEIISFLSSSKPPTKCFKGSVVVRRIRTITSL